MVWVYIGKTNAIHWLGPGWPCRLKNKKPILYFIRRIVCRRYATRRQPYQDPRSSVVSSLRIRYHTLCTFRYKFHTLKVHVTIFNNLRRRLHIAYIPRIIYKGMEISRSTSSTSISYLSTNCVFRTFHSKISFNTRIIFLITFFITTFFS